MAGGLRTRAAWGGGGVPLLEGLTGCNEVWVWGRGKEPASTPTTTAVGQRASAPCWRVAGATLCSLPRDNAMRRFASSERVSRRPESGSRMGVPDTDDLTPAVTSHHFGLILFVQSESEVLPPA